jgi:hypothetical protein
MLWECMAQHTMTSKPGQFLLVYISMTPYKARKVDGLFEKHDNFFSHYTKQVSGG